MAFQPVPKYPLRIPRHLCEGVSIVLQTYAAQNLIANDAAANG